MTELNVAIIYFSATNVTETYARAIQTEINASQCRADLINITTYSSRQKEIRLDAYDGVVFGFPVYSDFAPSVVNEWLAGLDGKGKKCAMFFTYGGRTTGYAHFHTMQILRKANFQVEFSAEFLGPHTYNVAGWTALTDRPSKGDLATAYEFAKHAVDRFASEKTANFNLQKPFGYNAVMESKRNVETKKERGWTNPTRVVEECDHCLLCETECPVNAFDAETGLSNFETCISCMHCVYICPNHAIKINEGMKAGYQYFLTDWNLSEEMMSAKKSRLITEASQAAA
jgi:Fe-S-cluster-containing hydrogenase component 2/flavodoxin